LSFKPSDAKAVTDLTGRERLRLVGAGVALPVSLVLLKTVGYQRTLRIGERLAGGRPAPADAADRVRSTTRLVLVANDRLPLPTTCLSRSLALWYLLRRQGVRSEIQIGVRAGGQPLDAHAWVVYDGQVLNDDEARTSTYAVLRQTHHDG
jgi:hypothetical protein